MSENVLQFLETIIVQCLGEHHIQPPLIVTMGDNCNVLVVNVNERLELAVLTKHREKDTFTLPLSISIVGQDSRTARLVIERDGSIGGLH